ncbi:unnamed protein product, partial [marine sediment metagenome]
GFEKGSKGVKRKKVIKIITESNAFQHLKVYNEAKKYFNLLSKKFDVHVVSHVDLKWKKKRKNNLKGFQYKSINCNKIHKEVLIEQVVEKYAPKSKKKDIIVIEDGPLNIPKLVKEGYSVFHPAWHGYCKDLEGQAFKNWKNLYNMINK